jgi:hypothetical protein
MAGSSEKTESGGSAVLWLAAAALLLGIIAVCWLLVASQSNLSGDAERQRRQSDELSRRCLNALMRSLTPDDALDPHVTTASVVARAPGLFRGQKMADLAFDDHGAPSGLPPKGVVVTRPESDAACLLRVAPDPGGVTLTAIGVVPYDWDRPLAEAFSRSAAQARHDWRFDRSLDVGVFGRRSVIMDPGAAIVGSGGVLTGSLAPPPAEKAVGCVCGSRPLGSAPLGTCPQKDCDSPHEERSRNGQLVTFVFPANQAWNELIPPPPPQSCSFSLQDNDALFFWDRTDVAHGCDVSRCVAAPSDAACPHRSSCWKAIGHLKAGERFRLLQPTRRPGIDESVARAAASCVCPDCGSRAGLEFWQRKTKDWELQLPCTSAHQSPTTVFVDNGSGPTALVNTTPMCASDQPPSVTVVASGPLQVADNVRMAAPDPQGTVLQAGGRCFLGRDVRLDGAIRCETIQARSASSPGGTRLRGSLYASTRCNSGKCPDDEPSPAGWENCRVPSVDFDCDDPGICLGDNIDLTGNALTPGDICLGQHVHVYGGLAAQDDVGIEEDDVIIGRVVGGDTVGLGPGAAPGRVLVRDPVRQMPGQVERAFCGACPRRAQRRLASRSRSPRRPRAQRSHDSR